MKRLSLLLVPALLVSLTQIAGAQSLPFAKPETIGMSSDRLARLDAAMQADVDSGRKVGIVALVARRGQIAHFKAYGMAERESGTRMTTEHLFRLYRAAGADPDDAARASRRGPRGSLSDAGVSGDRQLVKRAPDDHR